MTQLDLFTSPRKPPLPPHVGTPTSRAAAEAFREGAATIRNAVYGVILASGAAGMTDEEIYGRLLETYRNVKESTTRARRVELVAAGLVLDSGRVRLTQARREATVWRAA